MFKKNLKTEKIAYYSKIPQNLEMNVFTQKCGNYIFPDLQYTRSGG